MGIALRREPSVSQLFFVAESGLLLGVTRVPYSVAVSVPFLKDELFSFESDGTLAENATEYENFTSNGRTPYNVSLCRLDNSSECVPDSERLPMIPSTVSANMIGTIDAIRDTSNPEVNDHIVWTEVMDLSGLLLANAGIRVRQHQTGRELGFVFASCDVQYLSHFVNSQVSFVKGQRAFVMDANPGHTLIATSHGKASELTIGKSLLSASLTVLPKKISVLQSDDPVIYAAASYVNSTLGGDWSSLANDSTTTSIQVPNITADNKTTTTTHVMFVYYMESTNRINVFLVTTFPREAFIGRIERNYLALSKSNRELREQNEQIAIRARMMAYILVAALVATFVGVATVLTLRTVRPLLDLSNAMSLVAVLELEGLDDVAERDSRILEVASMQDSFIKMVNVLKEYRAFVPQAILMSAKDGAHETLESVLNRTTGHSTNNNMNNRTPSLPSEHTPTSPKSSMTSVFAIANGDGSSTSTQQSKQQQEVFNPLTVPKASTPTTPQGGSSSTSIVLRQLPDEPRVARLRDVGLKPFPATFVAVRCGHKCTFSSPDDTALTDVEMSHYNIPQEFVAHTLSVVEQFEGVVTRLDGDTVVSSWNAFRPCSMHEAAGCAAALDLRYALNVQNKKHPNLNFGKVRTLVTGGTVHVGFLGTNATRSPVVMGDAVACIDPLMDLANRLDSEILVTEVVAQKVKTRFTLSIVDVVMRPEASSPMALYELSSVLSTISDSGADTSPSSSSRMFRVAFGHLSALQVKEAEKGFTNFLLNHGLECDPMQRLHAIRLIRICRWLQTQPDLLDFGPPYCRTYPTWADFEAKSSELSLPDLLMAFETKTRTSKPRLAANSNGNSNNKQRPSASAPHSGLLILDHDGDDSDFDDDEDDHPPAESLTRSVQDMASGGASPYPERTLRSEVERALAVAFEAELQLTSSNNNTADNGPQPVLTIQGNRRYHKSSRVIGKGATCSVNLGLTDDGTQVAMKCMTIIDIDKSSDDTTDTMSPSAAAGGSSAVPAITLKKREIEKVLDEIQMMSELRHDNIVSLLDTAISGNEVIVIQEYVSGGTLGALRENFGVLPVHSVRRYLREILHGLAYLHKNDILHRDIKPHNVLLMIDGQCKLADFGAAAKLSARLGGRWAGTPLYMAPEACRGQACKASDIWSIGVMTVQMLTGRVPYSKEQLSLCTKGIQYFVAALGKDPKMVPVVPSTLPECAVGFVVACLQRDPEKRPTVDLLLTHEFIT
eukprot:PhM_4_TR18091/c0_g1_i2/m.49252/K17533/MAP3K19, YSK4; mitogen-activated protein kinase kinase kinase 19